MQNPFVLIARAIVRAGTVSPADDGRSIRDAVRRIESSVELLYSYVQGPENGPDIREKNPLTPIAQAIVRAGMPSASGESIKDATEGPLRLIRLIEYSVDGRAHFIDPDEGDRDARRP